MGRLLYVYPTAANGDWLQYDGHSLIVDYGAGPVIRRRYVHGPGVDEPLVWYEGSGTSERRWFHADERGSVIAVSDASGNLVGSINRYDEYGVPQGGTLTGRFGYTGQMWIPEIGMFYYRARIYNPGFRFMQTDPIGYGGGMNLYPYPTDPVNRADPLGLWASRIFYKRDDKGHYGGVGSTMGPSSGGGASMGGSGTLVKITPGRYNPATGEKTLGPSTFAYLSSGFELASAQSGGRDSGQCRVDPLVCDLLADPDTRERMVNSWNLANAGAESEEDERGFWIKQRGGDYIPDRELVGNGPVTPSIMRDRPPGANIYFHTHNFRNLPSGLSELDAMLLSRNPIIMVIHGNDGWQVFRSPLLGRGD